MKSNFVKNIFIFLLSMVAVLIYFKMLAYYIDIEILAKYFEVKAFGMIIFYFLSIRYSEFSYILKAQNHFTLYRMNRIYSLYALTVLLLTCIILSLIKLIGIEFYVYIFSYLIFLLNDLIDSYVAIYRLYHKYAIIAFVKGLLLFKPLFFYILINFSNVIVTFEILFIFEFYFHLLFAILIVFLIIKKMGVNNIFLYRRVYSKNLVNIKNTWLGSVYKIPYEALPTYLLSFFVSSTSFVEYNVARKVYAMVNYANQPFLQILNTYSIEYKNEFRKYLFLYYGIIFSLNLFIGLIVFKYGNHVISFLSNDIYATTHTLILVHIMFSIYMLYHLVYPVRQYIVLHKHIDLNNKATIYSMFMMVICTFLVIPIYKTYGISVVQPLGLIMPIIFSIFLLIEKKKGFVQ